MFMYFGQRDKGWILSRSLEEICISLHFYALSRQISSPECSAILLLSILYSHFSDNVICNYMQEQSAYCLHLMSTNK